jgi:uncharacterized DUF497 family protein
MRMITWSETKNAWLKKHRGVGFEQVAVLLEQGKTVDVYDHPDQDKYPSQKIAVVAIDEYALLVPFDVDGDEIVLRTIIPSRKSTKRYLGEGRT